MLSPYGKREWQTVLAIGLMVAVTFGIVGWYGVSVLALAAAAALLAFFRDPQRKVPTQRGVAVSPADGRVSSVHRVERFEPFDGPATCVRVFLSVFDVHVNRAPCHGVVHSVTHRSGQHFNALNPRSAEVNESNLMVLYHPTHRRPVAAVRQVAGAIARTIVCEARPGQTLQRGERFGMIKFGSTMELYLPDTVRPEVVVAPGQRVVGGVTVLANVSPTWVDRAGAGDVPRGAATAASTSPGVAEDSASSPSVGSSWNSRPSSCQILDNLEEAGR
jgi:phosphatidylserine decarboxylase